MMAVAPDIARLTNREADRLLVQAEEARRAEIDAYWALCQAAPLDAQQLAHRAPILDELLQLARTTQAAPPPGSSAALCCATARLLEVAAIRAAVPGPAFWEDGAVVALKAVDGRQVLVVRYDSALFNPATVPDESLAGGASWRLVCHRGGDFEFVQAYIIGAFDVAGRWTDVLLDLAARSALMRDLAAMEALVGQGRLADAAFDAPPLPTFPSASTAVITQLHAHQAVLRRAGAMSSAQQAVVANRTAPLHARIAALRQQMRQQQEALHQLRCDVREVEAGALEEETGFARGDLVRHRATDDAGVLEIVDTGTGAQFRLAGTALYVTEDIRRGEWVPVRGGTGAA